jgi:hypothetical protein
MERFSAAARIKFEGVGRDYSPAELRLLPHRWRFLRRPGTDQAFGGWPERQRQGLTILRCNGIRRTGRASCRRQPNERGARTMTIGYAHRACFEKNYRNETA